MPPPPPKKPKETQNKTKPYTPKKPPTTEHRTCVDGFIQLNNSLTLQSVLVSRTESSYAKKAHNLDSQNDRGRDQEEED